MAFFCGHHHDCDVFEGEANLARAKENVERYFAVVGVLEELGKSLELLEEYVPFYFRNARNVFDEVMKNQEKNKNIYKPKVPKEVKELVRQNFTREMEFFEFCKQRLQKQYLLLS